MSLEKLVASVAPYDVASIRINHSTSGNQHVGASIGRLSAENATLRALIQVAYQMPERFRLLVGGPAWIDDTHFDIRAKMDGDPPIDPAKLPAEERQVYEQAERLAPFQKLLADRFQLKLHDEDRVMPIFALVVTKSGIKAKASNEESDRGKLDPMDMRSGIVGFVGVPGLRVIGKGRVVAIKVTFDQLAKFFTGGAFGEIDRPVVNKTGLTGEYDFTLDWTPGSIQGNDDPSPYLFTAIQEQLGLKLEPQKGPVDVTVIDHAELPSEN